MTTRWCRQIRSLSRRSSSYGPPGTGRTRGFKPATYSTVCSWIGVTYIYIYIFLQKAHRQTVYMTVVGSTPPTQTQTSSHFANSSLAHRPSDSPTHSTAAAVTSHPSDDQDNKDSGFCSALGEEEEEEETLLHVDTAGSIIKQQWVASNPQLHRATPRYTEGGEDTTQKKNNKHCTTPPDFLKEGDGGVCQWGHSHRFSGSRSVHWIWEKKKPFQFILFFKKLDLVPREQWIQNKTVITLGWKFSFRTSFIRM